MSQATSPNNIATNPLLIEVTESSAVLLSEALPFPVIFPDLGRRNRGSGVQPAARPLVEIGLDLVHAPCRTGMNCGEIESHRAQESDLQLGARIVAEVDLF